MIISFSNNRSPQSLPGALFLKGVSQGDDAFHYSDQLNYTFSSTQRGAALVTHLSRPFPRLNVSSTRFRFVRIVRSNIDEKKRNREKYLDINQLKKKKHTRT